MPFVSKKLCTLLERIPGVNLRFPADEPGNPERNTQSACMLERLYLAIVATW